MKQIKFNEVDKIKLVDNLYLSEKLDDLGATNLVNTSIGFIFIFFAVLTLWMYLVNVQEIARAAGVVIPADNIYPIQHLEGGIVYKSFVNDGAIVQRGSTLFEFSPEPAVSELYKLYNAETTILFNIARLNSFLANKHVSREDLEKIINYRNNDRKALDLLIDNTLLLFQHQTQQRQHAQESVDELIKNKEIHIINLDKQINNLSERTDLLSTQTEIYKDLNKVQYASKINVINSQDKEQEVFGEYLAAVREKNNVESSIIELNNQKRMNDINTSRLALEDLNKQIAELLEIRKQIEKSQDRVSRLRVVSPIYGIVKGSDIKPGKVVNPGEVLFEIVPITKQLVIEAKISPKDVGHISLGDPVKIKVSSFDYSIYGQLNGKVKHISANTFDDYKTEKYYKAILTLEKNYLGEDPSSNLVIPGMTVIADIQTDHRSLLTYFLKPINRTFYEAFRER
jgi:HlyD family secretion protein/adhesin transport system membrane fusion protein